MIYILYDICQRGFSYFNALINFILNKNGNKTKKGINYKMAKGNKKE